jgi:hypothetical protein
MVYYTEYVVFKKGKMFSKQVTELSYPDKSGSDAYRRFDYQVACVFQTLISLCDNNEDFFVLLDYLDDFVIVENSGKVDESISFCQVKSQNKGPFTLNMVVKQEWIKKQVDNYTGFTDPEVKNILLTNFGIKIGTKIVDDTSLVSLADYENSEEALPLISQIKDALNGKGSIHDFYLLKATLSLDGFENQLKGTLVNYALKHDYKKTALDTIQTIYLEIWKELNSKQHFVLAEKDHTNFQAILDKKGMKYSQIKDIFRTAMDVQVPGKGEMSTLYAAYPFSLGSVTLPEFLDHYETFRIESAKHGAVILKECSLCVKSNKKAIDSCSGSLDVSSKISALLSADVAINSSEFFVEFQYQITALFVYKTYSADFGGKYEN